MGQGTDTHGIQQAGSQVKQLIRALSGTQCNHGCVARAALLQRQLTDIAERTGPEGQLPDEAEAHAARVNLYRLLDWARECHSSLRDSVPEPCTLTACYQQQSLLHHAIELLTYVDSHSRLSKVLHSGASALLRRLKEQRKHGLYLSTSQVQEVVNFCDVINADLKRTVVSTQAFQLALMPSRPQHRRRSRYRLRRECVLRLARAQPLLPNVRARSRPLPWST
jgi:hypothetical protein